MNASLSYNTCSFFGHRKINLSNNLEINLENQIEDLIVNHNVCNFLFGSRSEFNHLCLTIVSKIKKKYPFIKRIAYTCKSETYILQKEIQNKDFYLLNYNYEIVDEEFEHPKKYTAGKASYIERNKSMIDASDYCIFYYDEQYQPQSTHKNKATFNIKSKSGTKIAYNYALQRKKTIFNLF